MSVYLVPVTNVPQRFEISLAGIDYILVCKWNSALEGGWVLDFLNANDSTPIVANVPLIVGANLLSGLNYLGFGGSLIVYTDGNAYASPTLENLGIESNLYFVTEDI